uniref:Probable WRKY transcription factor 19 n=1 Tax=Sinocyclocheilus grahami TaxID=75366 RepID=A0A672N4T5_SINGR
MPPNENDVLKSVIAASMVTQRIVIAPPKKEAQDDRKTSQLNTKAPVPVTTTGVLPNTIGLKHTEAVNVTLPNRTVPKTAELVVPAMPQCTAPLVPNNPPKLTLPDSTPIQTFLPVATVQSSGQSSVNTPTTKMTTSQDATLLPPSHKPPKSMGLNVTTATKEAFVLRQVQSCPNSLQRLQVTGGKADLVHTISTPLANKGTEAAIAANHVSGGIQIKITPATDKNPVQTKNNNPPKTCFKVIDDVSPQPALFNHRFVSLKSNPPPSDTFSIHTREVLGGGRFGKVHKCTETKTGMRLAAKIINTRNARERVSRSDLCAYPQQCAPREKLKVSFGTPEFLAPEVVNFDFVSFPTDMWTLGVVTYMLLSGLSPFLGDDDSQTLNNVLMGNWYFDEDAFEHVSAEARDFVSNLLIRERSGRLSATQCLKHPWLNNITEKAKSTNIVLKSQALLKKYMARRIKTT